MWISVQTCDLFKVDFKKFFKYFSLYFIAAEKLLTDKVVYMGFFCGIVSSNDAPSWRHFACIFESDDVGYYSHLWELRSNAQCIHNRHVYDMSSWLFIVTCWSKQYGFNLVHHPQLEKQRKISALARIWTQDPCHSQLLENWRSRPLGYGSQFEEDNYICQNKKIDYFCWWALKKVS